MIPAAVLAHTLPRETPLVSFVMIIPPISRASRSFMAGLASIAAVVFTVESAAAQSAVAARSWARAGAQGDFVIRNFQFRNGETLPELKLHYTTLGTPRKDARGIVRNAVMILHGTGGSGRSFLSPAYAGNLFGPGQLLDSSRAECIAGSQQHGLVQLLVQPTCKPHK